MKYLIRQNHIFVTWFVNSKKVVRTHIKPLEIGREGVNLFCTVFLALLSMLHLKVLKSNSDLSVSWFANTLRKKKKWSIPWERTESDFLIPHQAPFLFPPHKKSARSSSARSSLTASSSERASKPLDQKLAFCGFLRTYAQVSPRKQAPWEQKSCLTHRFLDFAKYFAYIQL